MSLGSNIRYLRTRQKLTMEELGAAVGVSKQGIMRYEQDLAKPQPVILINLAKTLCTTAEDLVLRTDWDS